MFRRGDGEGPHAHWPGTPAFGLVLAITVAFGSAIALLYSPLASAQGEVCPSASDHNYMGQYPSDREGPWSEEAQGVAHDHTNWFLTQRSRLIKFPVDFDISSNLDWNNPPPGVLSRGIPGTLAEIGYNHFGDLDQYAGFVFIPIEGPRPLAGVGVFRASTLSFVDHVRFTRQERAAWVAVNHAQGSRDGSGEVILYTSDEDITSDSPIYRYKLDISTLESTNDLGASLTYKDPFRLFGTTGQPLDPPLRKMQGGVFTPWGDLYLVNGNQEASVSQIRGGIHLFDEKGRLIAESVNEQGLGGFKYEYHPDSRAEEPEGIDWWNRDSPILPASPNIRGQLHALLLDNDWEPFDNTPDDVYFKHYEVDYRCVGSEDTDGDGLADGVEAYLRNTDPLDPDTDNDGLSDSMEVEILHTDPLAVDTDRDGTPDGQEDLDGDGLTNWAESTRGTDPTDPDTDDDGLSDRDEVNRGTDPLEADSDRDGITDGAEVNQLGTNPSRADTDSDGLEDGSEVDFGTDPTAPDSDDDGLTDGEEVELTGTDPLVVDTDGDGLSDGREIRETGTNPTGADTDRDGLPDGDEVARGLNPNLADTDGGGDPDGLELGRSTNPLDSSDDSAPRFRIVLVVGIGVVGGLVTVAVLWFRRKRLRRKAPK